MAKYIACRAGMQGGLNKRDKKQIRLSKKKQVVT